jgi:hypothetical protein
LNKCEGAQERASMVRIQRGRENHIPHQEQKTTKKKENKIVYHCKKFKVKNGQNKHSMKKTKIQTQRHKKKPSNATKKQTNKKKKKTTKPHNSRQSK